MIRRGSRTRIGMIAKAAFMVVAIASMSIISLDQSLSVHAGTQPLQTSVAGRPVLYNDPFSPSISMHRTDAELGFTTHWEGLVDLSTPDSPITWSRVRDVNPAGGIRPHITGGIRPRISCDQTNNWCADTCTGTGGIRLWQHADESGDCIKYTKDNPNISAYVPLQNVQYPFSSNYVRYSESFSTFGSTGSGTLDCGGGNWNYSSNTNYGNLYNASGGKCNGSVGNLQTLHIN